MISLTNVDQSLNLKLQITMPTPKYTTLHSESNELVPKSVSLKV